MTLGKGKTIVVLGNAFFTDSKSKKRVEVVPLEIWMKEESKSLLIDGRVKETEKAF